MVFLLKIKGQKAKSYIDNIGMKYKSKLLHIGPWKQQLLQENNTHLLLLRDQL